MIFYRKNAASKIKLGKLYERYSRVMFGAAFNVLHDRQLAEDAVHMAFQKIMERKASLPDDDGSDRTKAFMAIIAKNVATDLLRSRKQEKTVPLEPNDEMEAPDDPMKIILDQESVAYFERAMRNLPGSIADTMRLRYLYDLEIRDIVELLHISADNVSSRLYRGRNMLLRLMEKEAKRDETEN